MYVCVLVCGSECVYVCVCARARARACVLSVCVSVSVYACLSVSVCECACIHGVYMPDHLLVCMLVVLSDSENR